MNVAALLNRLRDWADPVNASYRRRVAALEERCCELQEGVDTAYSALSSSAYVGGPTEREAFRVASNALGPLATQHIGQPRPE